MSKKKEAKETKEAQEASNRKVQLSFTLKKSVNDKFLGHCKERMLNKSQLLESIIIAYMDSVDFAGMEKRM